MAEDLLFRNWQRQRSLLSLLVLSELLLITEDRTLQKRLFNSMLNVLRATRANWFFSQEELESQRRERFQIPLLRNWSLLMLRSKTSPSTSLESLKENSERRPRRSLKKCLVSKLTRRSSNWKQTRSTRESVRREPESKLRKMLWKRNEPMIDIWMFQLKRINERNYYISFISFHIW